MTFQSNSPRTSWLPSSITFSVALMTISCMSCSTLNTKPRKIDPFTATTSTTTPNPANASGAVSTAEEANNAATIASLTARIKVLEQKLATLDQNLSHAKTGVDNLLAAQKAKPTPVASHPADLGGTPLEVPDAKNDPSAGFISDNAVRAYRKAMIIFNSQNFAEAVTAFSEFLEKYPDHPVAGMAQYYVGESYLMQSNYRKAVQEFQKVLTSYDRSAYVAQTLREMAEAEDQLKQGQNAAHHRQLLMSLFPHSPYAVERTAQNDTRPNSQLSVPPVSSTETEAKTENAATSEAIAPHSILPSTPAPEAHKTPIKLDEPPLADPVSKTTEVAP